MWTKIKPNSGVPWRLRHQIDLYRCALQRIQVWHCIFYNQSHSQISHVLLQTDKKELQGLSLMKWRLKISFWWYWFILAVLEIFCYRFLEYKRHTGWSNKKDKNSSPYPQAVPWRNNIRSRLFFFIETDQVKVKAEKELAQIFTWIIFLLQKKTDFSFSILSARMQYVSAKFLRNQ